MHARRGPTIAYNAPQRRHASSCFALLPCVRILRYATCMDDAKRRKVLDSTGAIVPLPAPSQQQVVEFKPPGRFLKPKKHVVEEERFVAALEKIITRDFYPDLPKLQAQHEYLEALESNDMDKLRDVAIRYQTPVRASAMMTPASFETPAPSDTPRHPGSPSRRDDAFSVTNASTTVRGSEVGKDGEDLDTNLSLNDFLHKYTSEDNCSFEEIIQDAQDRLRKRHAHLYEASARQAKHLALTGEAKLAIKDSGVSVPLDTWKHEPANALMFHVPGAEYSEQEKIDIVMRGTVRVNHTATRFEKLPFPGGTSAQGSATTASATDGTLNGPAPGRGAPALVISGGNDSPRVNGFGFVVTPSPAPAIDNAPAMTWGMIDGTPFRLDAGDVRAAPGPVFKIPESSSREKLGIKLADKVAEKTRGRTRTSSVASEHSAAKVPGTPGQFMKMSPAAQKLTRQMYKNAASQSPGIFSNTPLYANSMTRTKTPLLTPRKTGGQTPLMPVPAVSAPSRDTVAAPQISVTDDLLS